MKSLSQLERQIAASLYLSLLSGDDWIDPRILQDLWCNTCVDLFCDLRKLDNECPKNRRFLTLQLAEFAEADFPMEPTPRRRARPAAGKKR